MAKQIYKAPIPILPDGITKRTKVRIDGYSTVTSVPKFLEMFYGEIHAAKFINGQVYFNQGGSPVTKDCNKKRVYIPKGIIKGIGYIEWKVVYDGLGLRCYYKEVLQNES
jgi:hypothetical protein